MVWDQQPPAELQHRLVIPHLKVRNDKGLGELTFGFMCPAAPCLP